ncbi:MAG: tetratricopeptide repeat protein [Acidobacteria bacterium]|nr:tetratricopeptide repeat protein [Acidobacteriota bacterium]
MDKNTILLVIIALLAGFIGGFMVANSMNRTAVTMGGPMPVNSAGTAGNSNRADDLSPEEIRAKIAEADQNADKFSFQKDLGVALYRYGAMKQDDGLIAESVRILERAAKLEPKDFDVLVALGNGRFDIGFYRKDNDEFEKARTIYLQALALKPSDADVQTDLGLTYYLQEPPDYTRAIAELNKAGQMRPTHERSLQFIVQAHLRQQNIEQAEQALDKLRALNPTSPAVSELTAMVNTAKTGAPK